MFMIHEHPASPKRLLRPPVHVLAAHLRVFARHVHPLHA